MQDYFPLTIATGVAFCNRADECKRLINNIKYNTHSWISAPRRYGKTSLIAQVFLDYKKHNTAFVYERIDLLLAKDSASAERKIVRTCEAILAKILPFHETAIRTIQRFFSRFNPKVTITPKEFRVELTPGVKDRDLYISECIASVLKSVDAVAVNEKKKWC